MSEDRARIIDKYVDATLRNVHEMATMPRQVIVQHFTEFLAEIEAARPSPTGEKVEAGTRREIEFHLDRMNAWLRDLWAVRGIDLHLSDGSTNLNQRGLLCDIRDDVGAMRAALAAANERVAELENALGEIEAMAESIRVVLVLQLTEQARSAFWKGVAIRNIARAALTGGENG